MAELKKTIEEQPKEQTEIRREKKKTKKKTSPEQRGYRIFIHGQA